VTLSAMCRRFHKSDATSEFVRYTNAIVAGIRALNVFEIASRI
jgi:hypothetical protein